MNNLKLKNNISQGGIRIERMWVEVMKKKIKMGV